MLKITINGEGSNQQWSPAVGSGGGVDEKKVVINSGHQTQVSCSVVNKKVNDMFFLEIGITSDPLVGMDIVP